MRLGRTLIAGVAVGGALVTIAFMTSAGADPSVPPTGSYTWTLIALAVLGAGACAGAVVTSAPGRLWGGATVALFAAFTALAALSITWSIQPDWSWYGANQLVAYLAVFTGAAALSRVVPERWPTLLGGVATAMTALCAWSLLVKVFPSTLDPSNALGRLQAPFGYWNAIGVCAALGIPACLWAGTRPGGARALRAACAPALTLAISVVVLSYSRSALLAALLGGGVWIVFVPLRLRSVALLAVGGAGAIPVVLWMLKHPALDGDAIALPAQNQAGHTFGLVVALVVVLVAGAGWGLTMADERIRLPELARRRIGTVLVCLVALVPVAAVAAAAASSRGLTGQISHAWHSLTSSTSVVKDTSSRLSQLGSSRPLYWGQGIKVGEHHVLAGAGELAYGVARLRYTTVAAKTDHAHSYLFQTFADLGLIGVGLTIALLIAWVSAAARALRPAVPVRLDERHGLIALAAIVVAFGVQSLLDWTWYFPGVSVPALLAAGWLAGRGPLDAPTGRAANRRRLTERPAAGAAVLVLAATALVCAWLMWEPLHSNDEIAAAENADTNQAAFAAARSAVSANPLSTQPLLQLSILYQGVRDNRAARAELVRATRLQPDNPEPWVWLATFDLQTGRIRPAVGDANRILVLDTAPRDPAAATASSILSQAPGLIAAQNERRRAAAAATAEARRRRGHRHRRTP